MHFAQTLRYFQKNNARNITYMAVLIFWGVCGQQSSAEKEARRLVGVSNEPESSQLKHMLGSQHSECTFQRKSRNTENMAVFRHSRFSKVAETLEPSKPEFSPWPHSMRANSGYSYLNLQLFTIKIALGRPFLVRVAWSKSAYWPYLRFRHEMLIWNEFRINFLVLLDILQPPMQPIPFNPFLTPLNPLRVTAHKR